MKNNNRESEVKTYIYAIIAVLSFILVAVGTTIAAYYYVNESDDNKPIKVKTAYVSAMFEATDNISSDKILPGWSDELKFSITNVSSEENAIGDYSLYWEIEKNELENDNFVYALVGRSYKNNIEIAEGSDNKLVSVVNEIKVPSVSVAIGDGIINTGVRHEYVLKISLKESGTNQNDLQAKTFKAKIVAKGEPSGK